MALLYTSCGDDDTSTTDTKDENNNNSGSIIGKWQLDSIAFDGKDETTDCKRMDTLEFTEENVTVMSFEIVTEMSTNKGVVGECSLFGGETSGYSTDGNKIDFDGSFFSQIDSSTFNVNGDVLTINSIVTLSMLPSENSVTIYKRK